MNVEVNNESGVEIDAHGLMRLSRFVMSWPMDELRPGSSDAAEESDLPLGHLGDIALCPTVAAAQGAKAGHGTWAELELLTVHDILHLLGYDHAEPAEKAEMWDVQGRLLEAWRAPGNHFGQE